MATLVVGAIGAAIGGAIGGGFAGLGLAAIGSGVTAATVGSVLGQTIGGLAGAYVDQLAINALFPQITKGPRASSFPDIQSGDGAPVNYPIGSRVRVPCVAIWVGPVKTRRRTQRTGKGGGGGKVRTYEYFRDVAFHLAGRPIRSVRKIIAEGDTLFEYDGQEPQQNQDGGGSTLVASDDQGRIAVDAFDRIFRSTTPGTLRRPKGRITSETQSGGPDLRQFAVGSTVSITGFTNPENNLIARVEEVGGNADGSTYLVCDHGATPDWIDESPAVSQVITIQQQTQGHNAGIVSDVFFHLGNQTTPNALIESVEGVGSSPVWFGDSYVVLQNVAMTKFGNRIPFFEAILEADTFTTIDLALTEILTIAGLAPEHFDVTACASIGFTGYNLQGITQPATAIAQLMQYYDLAARWSQDRLTFFPARERPLIELREVDLGAAIGEEEGDGAPKYLETADQASVTIPSSVAVSYLDATLDLAKGTETYHRPGAPFEGAQEVSIPVVSTAAEAREAAKRILWDGDNAREVFRVTLPANDVGLAVEENDRVRVVVRDREYEFIAAKTSRDEPGVVELLGPRTPARIVGTDLLESYLYPPPPAAEDPGGNPDDRVPAIPVLQLVVIDSRPLLDVHAFASGVYFGAAVVDGATEFLTGELHFSTDGGTTYTPIAPIDVEATMGVLETSFQNATATPRTIDTGESFRVRLFNPDFELESVTSAEMQAGRNWAWVAGELIAFTTATLQADGSYLIENVVRGLRGTESEEAAHAAGALFCLLDATGLGFAPVPLRELGSTLLFRAVSAGGLVSEAVDFPLDFEANTLRPMPLANYLVARDGADVITVSWDRQTRAVSDPLAVVEAPVLQPPERYRITFDDGTTVVEKSVTDARSFVYGTTAQTTDGFTPGNPIDVATREEGVVGEGPESEVSLA